MTCSKFPSPVITLSLNDMMSHNEAFEHGLELQQNFCYHLLPLSFNF